MSTHTDHPHSRDGRRHFLSLGRTPGQRRISVFVAMVSLIWPIIAHYCWYHPATWIISFVLYLVLTWTSGLKFTAAGLLGGLVIHMIAPPQLGRMGDLARLGACIASGVGFGALLDWLSELLYPDDSQWKPSESADA